MQGYPVSTSWEGGTFTLFVSATETIRDVKLQIQDTAGIPPDEQRLIFDDMELKDRFKVSEYNIGKGASLAFDVVTAPPRPSGGVFGGGSGGPPPPPRSGEGGPGFGFADCFELAGDDGCGPAGARRVRCGSLGMAMAAGSCGAGGLFADISDSSGLTVRAFSQHAPDWRTVEPGLCLEGKCLNQRCAAFHEMVIVNHGFRDFDLMRPGLLGERRCPECKSVVVPTTCGFTDCMWRYRGRKTGETNVLTGPWKKAGDSYHRFEEGREVKWDRLLIQARPLVKPRGRREPSTAERPTPTTTTPLTALFEIDHTWGSCTLCTDGSCDNDEAAAPLEVLPCGHRFHADCLAGWERDSGVVCPNCREVWPPLPQ